MVGESQSKCINREGYFTIVDLANRTKFKPKTIRGWIQSGKLLAEKIGKCLYIHDSEVFRIMSAKHHRRIDKDLSLMDLARKELWILGINSLGPLHQGREIIIKKLNNGVHIRILLLDPTSIEFLKRSKNEEEITKSDGKKYRSARLVSEYNASLAICRDIMNFVEGNGVFEVRVHDQTPTEAMVITDPNPIDKHLGICHYNPYPEKAQTRGVQGKHIPFSKKKDKDEFEKYVRKYDNLWNSAKSVNILGYPVNE